jgi:hypothetical protein
LDPVQGIDTVQYDGGREVCTKRHVLRLGDPGAASSQQKRMYVFEGVLVGHHRAQSLPSELDTIGDGSTLILQLQVVVAETGGSLVPGPCIMQVAGDQWETGRLPCHLDNVAAFWDGKGERGTGIVGLVDGRL